MISNALFTSKDQTWETPQELFDKLNRCFNFQLDVCALPETSKCDTYYTPEIDGLAQNWGDMNNICWMNPPYGREQIKWIQKANEENSNNFVTSVCLIPARPDTKIWQDVIFPNAKLICFLRGRLKFGNSKDSAPFPSAVVVFSNYITKEQCDTLESLGKVFINYTNPIIKV